MSEKCVACGGSLTQDDIGLTKKLINRGAEEFYCIDCLAERFKVPKSRLIEKIEQFKADGCLLFARK